MWSFSKEKGRAKGAECCLFKRKAGKNEKEGRKLKRNGLKVYGKLQKVRGCKISLLRLFIPANTKLKKDMSKKF